MALGDLYLSCRPLRLLPGAAPGAIAVDATASRTAVEVDGEPLAGRRELSAAEVGRGVVLLLAERVVLLLHRLDPVGDSPGDGLDGWGAAAGDGDGRLLGTSAAMAELRREIARAAPLAVPVLLRMGLEPKVTPGVGIWTTIAPST